MRRTFPDSGFSLMEVLVAFAILALGFLAIFNAYRVIIQGQHRSAQEILAQDAARSLIALAGTEIPLEDGHQSGRIAGDLEWRREITSLGSNAPPGKVRLFRIAVTITSTSGKMRYLTLSTIKLMAVDSAAAD